MSATVLENIKKSTEAWIKAVNAIDADAVQANSTDDFVFQILPHSLEHAAMNIDEFRGLWQNFMKPNFANFKLEPVFVMHDAETRRATIYADVSADLPIDYSKWQLIQMLKFNEDGTKMTRLDEFFDSKLYVEMVAALNEANAKKQ